MRQFMEVAKALAEENRIRILWLLKEHELCVCQILEVLELAPSTVSKHLSVLHHAKLLESTKKGRWVYYRIAGEETPVEVRSALAWVYTALVNNTQMQLDAKRLMQVLSMELEVLCKRQAEK
jgi:ArsR family transcriptional regulator, arsenate/arsenite/antimonite-responsive transcriptional repressor